MAKNKKLLIDDFRFEWELERDKGTVWVKIADQDKFKRIPIKSSGEFLVAHKMLTGPKPVHINKTTGVLGTLGNEPISTGKLLS